MGGNLLTIAANSGFVEVDGVISGSAGIVKNGAGNFNPFASNTYTGQTIINAGIVEIGDNNAPGASGAGNETIVNNGGTLDPFTRTLPEDILATGAGFVGIGAIDGAGVLTGNITLLGDTTISNNIANIDLTISGPIGDGGTPVTLSKIGQGTIVFAAANTYRGQTLVNQGVLSILDGGALGLGGAGVNEVQTLTVGGSSAGTFSLTFNGQTTSALSATATAAEVQAALDSLSSIGGVGGFVAVTQNANVYTVTFGGTLAGANQPQISAAGAGGTTVIADTLTEGSSNGTVVASGATLQVQGGITVANEPLTLNGSGVNNVGALENFSGANTWAGNILLNGNSSIAVRFLALDLAGAIGESSAASLTKVGPGTLVLSGSSSNTYTGTTFVNSGILQLNKSGGATAINGNLQIADFTSVQTLAPDQVSDTSIVSIFGTGLFDVPFAETIGALNMTRGQVNAAGGLRLSTGQITATSDASGFAASITGVLDLGGVTNVVTVNDGLGPVDLDISATITSGGFGGIQKEGPGTLQLSGSSSNTYSGTTFVNAGTLVLNKSPGSDAIPGTFVIGLFSGVQTVLLLAPDQIADTAQVQIFPSGGFGLNGFDDTIGSLQLRSGAARHPRSPRARAHCRSPAISR